MSLKRKGDMDGSWWAWRGKRRVFLTAKGWWWYWRLLMSLVLKTVTKMRCPWRMSAMLDYFQWTWTVFGHRCLNSTLRLEFKPIDKIYELFLQTHTRFVSYHLISEPNSTKCHLMKNYCQPEQSFQVIHVLKLKWQRTVREPPSTTANT